MSTLPFPLPGFTPTTLDEAWAEVELTSNEFDAQDIHARGIHGQTPLIRYIDGILWNGDEESNKEGLGVIHALVSAGVDINATDHQGTSALSASLDAPLSFTQTLLHLGADPNLENHLFQTPFEEFCDNGYRSGILEEQFQVLCEAGFDINAMHGDGVGVAERTLELLGPPRVTENPTPEDIREFAAHQKIHILLVDTIRARYESRIPAPEKPGQSAMPKSRL